MTFIRMGYHLIQGEAALLSEIMNIVSVPV